MTGGAPRQKAGSFKIGDTKVSVFNIGDFAMSLSDVFGKDFDLTRYFNPTRIANPSYYPNNSVLIETPENTILVDPGDRERLLSVYGFQPPAAQPTPPSLDEQLKEVGVRPSDIDVVVVTHLHYDHFLGVTRKKGEGTVPSFPKARYLVPKRDWEMPDIAEARKKEDRVLADTLGVVERSGLLSFIDGKKDIGGGITILPFPGESPGHQIVGASSKGAACFCVGDLYHLKEEVEHPELVASWADAEALIKSRNAFAELASRESALVFPGHMHQGRITVRGGAPIWLEA